MGVGEGGSGGGGGESTPLRYSSGLSQAVQRLQAAYILDDRDLPDSRGELENHVRKSTGC